MRQANSTIRGYLYQFNKSIFEILSAKEEDSITLEGVIEDIDIQNPTNITTIQCKYHEDKKFQISSIAEPILEMLCHYHECCAIGKSMSYILFAYYSDNVDSIDKNKFKEYIQSTTNKEILLAYFHRIYTIQDPRILQIANKNKKTTDEKNQIIDYYTKNRTALNLCVSLDDFWEHFTYHKAEQYDILSQKIIDKLSELADKETAENLYYPNAFSYISNLSSKPDVSQRTVTKKQLLDFLLTQKSILLSQWALEALDKAKILKKKKTHLSSYFSSNTDVRAFIFSDKFNELNSDSLITFIHAYINKYYKKPKLQKPPIFIFGNKSEDLFQNIVSELFKYQKYVNVGMVGNSFIAENFINNITYTNQVSCKMALLKNITIELLEKCNVNQLYIVGNILEDFSSCNYIINEVYRYIKNKNSEVINKNDTLPHLPKRNDGTVIENSDFIYLDEDIIFAATSTAKDTKASNGPYNGEFERFLTRLETKLSDKRLKFITSPIKVDGEAFKTEDFDIILKQFLGYIEKNNVTIIDLSAIPFEVLSIVVSLLSRIIFDFAFHYSKFRHSSNLVNDTPFMLVCEEAHNYIPKNGGAEYNASKHSIERIAKEGRKYGLNLMVVSQRPSEVSETIFSQCNNFIVLKLTNINDQSCIKNLLPDNNASLVDVLPTLAAGECLVVGDSVPLPAIVKMNMPNPIPSSSNVNVYDEWNKDWVEIAFEEVIKRWRKE